MSKYTISFAMMNRLPLYLDYLYMLEDKGIQNVSATMLAKDMGLGEVLVRKELSVISGNGRPRIGYKTSVLIKDFDTFLHVGKTTKAIIVGAGRLGQALLQHDQFNKFGVDIIAAFDNDDKKVDNKKIFNVSKLESFIKDKKVKIGIITVPKENAVEVYESLVAAGISGVWNFAPVTLKKVPNVIIRQQNLALSLAHLNIMLMNNEKLQETK
ncbi:MAG: redox-sensing transcriptional repressor Rex [Lachnospiraceae bacterium]|nr:redox-sensing transcriptional repressor Rex [Lachnospiraceae bacterium]